MKSNLLLATLTLLSTAGFSQMRVGSNAAATEMLHVEGAILIGESTIGAPEAGTIRWNSTANPDIFEGFDGTNWIPLQGDNLGDHNATENLVLNDFWLSNDGDDEGITIDDDGNVGVGTDAPDNLLHVKSNGTNEAIVGLFEHFVPNSSSGSSAGIKVTGRRGQATNDVAFLEFENNSSGNVLSRIHIRSDDRLRFSLNNGGSLVERLSLANNGALTINNEFTLPTTDGSNGQVLTTDGSGAVTWETPSSGGGTVEGWTVPGGVSGTAGTQVRYYKHDDRVYLDGAINLSGSFASTGQTIFTLPIGYRPSQNVICPVFADAVGNTNSSSSFVWVLANGEVRVGNYSNSNIWLSSVSFRVAP